jgi:hypothetical protein
MVQVKNKLTIAIELAADAHEKTADIIKTLSSGPVPEMHFPL